VAAVAAALGHGSGSISLAARVCLTGQAPEGHFSVGRAEFVEGSLFFESGGRHPEGTGAIRRADSVPRARI
jgi:hypothetical protein